MRGRKPVPGHLRILRGNPGHRPIPEEVQPILSEEPPSAPEWMPVYARIEWERLAPELHRLRLLNPFRSKPRLSLQRLTSRR
jgi:phage terminase small subunit